MWAPGKLQVNITCDTEAFGNDSKHRVKRPGINIPHVVFAPLLVLPGHLVELQERLIKFSLLRLFDDS